jgi:hypothetical protein
MLKEAVERKDIFQIGAIVDLLRENGSNYTAIYNRVKDLTGISLEAWDTLLEESDIAESAS